MSYDQRPHLRGISYDTAREGICSVNETVMVFFSAKCGRLPARKIERNAFAFARRSRSISDGWEPLRGNYPIAIARPLQNIFLLSSTTKISEHEGAPELQIARKLHTYSTKPAISGGFLNPMAEREGFEPPIALRLWLISSQLHSTGLCHLSSPAIHFTLP